MPSWRHLARLLSKSLLAKDTYELTIGIESDNFTFKAGQYVWVIIPELKFPDAKGNRRAFSIASYQQDRDKISIIFRDTGSGYKKSLLTLAKSARVEVDGPFGSSFVFEGNHSKNSVIIAGGTGIAPFLASLRSHAIRIGTKLTVIFLNSSKDRSFLTDELARLTSEKNFPFIQVVGQFEWSSLPSDLLVDECTFYVSGPQAMVDSVVPVLLEHKAKPESMVFEQCYPTPPGNLTLKDIGQFIRDKNNIGPKVIEQSNQHIVITDANAVVLYANEAAEKITGYAQEEMVGNTPRLWGGLMSPKFYKEFWIGKRTIGSFAGEITNRRKNGENYKAIVRISPILDKVKNIIAYVAMEEDITNRVELTERLEKHRQKLIEDSARDEAIFRNIGEGMVILNRLGEIVFVNDGFEKLLGYQRNEVLGKKMVDVVPKYDENGVLVQAIKRSVERVLSGEIKLGSVSTLTKTHYYLTKSGNKVYITGVVTPIIVEDRLIGAVQIFRDISKEKEVDRLKDEFLSIASHELRTPLSAIDGIISMIRSGEYGEISAEVKGALDDVNTASDRLIKLVNDLLNLSRIQAGRLKYTLSIFDISRLINEVCDLYKPIVVKQGLGLKVSENVSAAVQADADKVKQVMSNLLDNAMKYTHHGEIDIKSLIDGKLVKIFITDTGVGIEEADKRLLFGKFQQVGLNNGQHSGTGLGLHISREMIKKMGGDIWLEKSEIGNGSVFAFSLPLKI